MATVNPIEPNPQSPASEVEALAARWQELARQLRFLELRGTPVRFELDESLRRIVKRSSEAIRAFASGRDEAALGLQEPGTPRAVAMRMLGSGAAASDATHRFDSIDLAPGRSHRLLFSGTGSSLPAQDVVRQLGIARQTGVLKLRTAREIFTLELEIGKVAHLHTDTPAEGERLGELLVRQRVRSAAEIETIRKRNQRGRFGDVLLLGNHATPAQLVGALELQIHLLVGRLCQAEALNFSFWQGPLSLGAPRVRLEVSELMLGPIDEAPRIERPRPRLAG